MEWLPASGYSDYEVSDTGRVRRVTPHKLGTRWPVDRELTPQLQGRDSHHAYLRVKIGQKYVPVAHLVATAFLGPRPDGHEVNHKDGNKQNNSVTNLEWVTHKENVQHALQLGLRNPADWSGEKHGMAKLTEDAVRAILATPRGETGRANGTNALATKYGVCTDTIRLIRRRAIWKHIE